MGFINEVTVENIHMLPQFELCRYTFNRNNVHIYL